MTDQAGYELGDVEPSHVVTAVAVGMVAYIYETEKQLAPGPEDDPAVWERRWKVAKAVLGTVAAAFILFMLFFVSRP
jgi:hypothetical protein